MRALLVVLMVVVAGGSGSEPLSLSFTGAANEQSSLLRLLPPFSLSPPTSGRGANEL